MEKNAQNGKSAQGAENTPKNLSIEDVRGYVKKDLGVCIHMLDAIYKDQATVDMVADILYGRYLNAKHKEELEKQTKLGV